jgi:hypothetical protein
MAYPPKEVTMHPASLLNLPVDLMHRAAPEAQPQPGGERGERLAALVVALAVLAFGAVAGLSW